MSTAAQTFDSFREKWENNPDLAFALTQQKGSEIQSWILNRNGFNDCDQLRAFLAGKRRILDAGCGNGRVTALLHAHSSEAAQIVGVDLTAAEVARRNLAGYSRVTVHQADLMRDLSALGQFDFIYCQEVLHHTRDPKQAFLNLVALLEPGGEIAIYVYKIKAPAREFVDDYVRHLVSGCDYADAMRHMQQITELGRVLTETGLKVTVPTVDVLGIEAGEYDVQRFLYHFFCKCFWNPELSFEANVAINYDWYHPQLCTRHTVEEISGWFEEADLSIDHTRVDPYGITVRGRVSDNRASADRLTHRST
jgi:SAM-dependent methyltransferase